MLRLIHIKAYLVSRVVFLFLILFMSLALWSQTTYNDIYSSFINLNETNGLSNNSINDIYQDVNGYIWIATKEGLNRFDGNKFICFKNIENDSTSISDNLITSIAADSKGNLWVGTANGLNKYDRKSGTFIRYKSSPILPHTLRNNYIRKILLQRDSLLWLETIDGTLSRMNILSGKFDHFSHKPIHQSNYLYHTLWNNDNGDIWIGGRNLGIHILDIKKKTFRQIDADPTNPQKKRDNDLAALLKTSKGIYYASGTDGFYSFDPKTELFTKLYSSSTFSLSELQDGRIVMGTGSGLVIYNPTNHSIIKYINNAANPKSLINNHINKVFIDKAGNIWAGTNEGISIFKQLESGINNYFYIPGNPTSLSSNKISSILQDSKNRIWIGTEDQGLNLWETPANTFKHFKNKPGNSKSLASNKITKIYEDRKGNLWIGLWAGVGFNKFNPEKNQFTKYAISKYNLKSDWYNDILEDSQGNFWLGFWGSNGFQSFDRNKGKFTPKHFFSRHVPINISINDLLSDGKKNLFIKTGLPIIYIYETESGLFKAHISSVKYESDTAGYKHHLPDLPINPTQIFSMETNKKGLTCIATDDGLIAFEAKNKLFSKINYIHDTVKHIAYHERQKAFFAFSNNSIYKIDNTLKLISTSAIPDKFWQLGKFQLKCDSEGYFWLLAEKGVYRFFPQKELGEEIDFSDLDYHFEKTNLISIQGELLISSNTGLWRVSTDDISKRSKIEFPNHPTFLSNINYLSKLNDEKVLIVSIYGLGILNLPSNTIEFINLEYLPENFGYNISGLALSQNKMFLSSNLYLFELDLSSANKKIRHINTPNKYMVSSRLTSAMVEDENGNIWVGTTDGGLNKMNPKTETFEHYTQTNSSLPSNEITCLALDLQNKVWIGTNNGLCSFDNTTRELICHSKHWDSFRIASIISSSDSILWLGTNHGLIRYNTYSLKHQIFREADGLPTQFFNKGASLLNNGLLIMATDQGIVTFYPKELTNSSSSKKVEITGFNLFDEPFNLNIQSEDTINLNYKNNFFSIDFSTLNFDSPNTAIYSYTISGMGSKWISTTTPSANFTNLSAGNYLFSVCQQGFESDPDAQAHLSIFISPPFWKTFWFWAVNFILIGSIGLIFLITYIRQIKISEQNALLEQRLLTSQMNPHFIFNSLSAIQSFIYKNEAEVAGNYLSDFSSLVRLILENSRAEYISLEKEIKTLRLYIGLQQLRFLNKFDYEIIIDPKIDRKSTSIPPMLAQPFIENAIEHGIMHLARKGTISVHFGIKQDRVSIEVIDDGIGLKQSKLNNLKRETHTSFATSITYERLTNLTRGGNKNIGISVTDRSDTEDTTGTRVYLEVPFKKIIWNVKNKTR